MENKINIAELLKDCPKGMELDCLLYDNVTFISADDDKNEIYTIKVSRSDGCEIYLTKYGQYECMDDAKCVIFPKGKTTWEGFIPPCKFMDGDVVSTNDGSWVGITTGGKSKVFIPTYCIVKSDGEFEAYLGEKKEWRFDKLATEEEKAKLFDAIKDNGYKWNEETKTLEKLLKFKIGDRIVKRNGISVPVLITGIGGNYYYSNTENSVEVLPFAEQDDYELVLDKFDIYTLVPFESRVLIRNDKYSNWKPAIFGCYMKDKTDSHYSVLGGTCWRYCIPYEGNEHLLGTTTNCDDFYKTW